MIFRSLSFLFPLLVKDTPIEAQRLAVQCYINLQNYHVSTKAMLNPDFMQELLNIMTVITSKFVNSYT